MEFSLAHLREALGSGLTITVVCKWYHRRALHALKILCRGVGAFHAVSGEPVYAGKAVTRRDRPARLDGARRVIREWEECTRRVDGAWR